MNTKSLVAILLIIAVADGCQCNQQDFYFPCDCENSLITEASAIASPSFTSGSWSTYEHAGSEFTADATCHTSMRVIFFWLDSARHATDEIPPIVPSFETPTGYFPPATSEAQRSAFITVGGQSVHAWEYWVNEAANKDTPEATSYQAGWTYDTNYNQPGEVYVLISIAYKVFDPNEHARDVEKPCN